MMKHTVSGPLSARGLAPGAWLLTGDAGGPKVYLWGAGPEAVVVLEAARLTRVTVEWSAAQVRVSVTGADGVRYFNTGNAVIHEPKERLYETLPLARFDAKARWFWRRVFLLMRIPGGRLFLGFMARRSRAKRGLASQ